MNNTTAFLVICYLIGSESKETEILKFIHISYKLVTL